MSFHKQLPNSMRNIRARIRPLLRPAVWGPASILLLAVVLMSEYLAHPERLTTLIPQETQSDKSNAQPGLSPEESAKMAEIDRLPVLLDDLNRSKATSNPQSPESSIDKLLMQQKLGLTPNSGQQGKSANEAQNNLNAGQLERVNISAGTGNSKPLGVTSVPGLERFEGGKPSGVQSALPSTEQIYNPTLGNSILNATTGTGNAVAPVSPLQSALDRYKINPSTTLPSANTDGASETQASFDAGFTGVAQSFPNKPGITPAGASLDEFNPPYRGPRPGRDPGRLSSSSPADPQSLAPTFPGQLSPTNYGLPDPNSLTPGATNINPAVTPGATNINPPDNSYNYLTGTSQPISPALNPAPAVQPAAPGVTPADAGQSPLPNSNSPLLPQSRPALPSNSNSQPVFPGFNSPGTPQGLTGTSNNYGQSPLPGFNAPGGFQAPGLPPAPSGYGQSPLPGFNSGSPTGNSNNYGTPGLPASQINQPSSLSAPSTIGGGQINTFSNPTR